MIELDEGARAKAILKKTKSTLSKAVWGNKDRVAGDIKQKTGVKIKNAAKDKYKEGAIDKTVGKTKVGNEKQDLAKKAAVEGQRTTDAGEKLSKKGKIKGAVQGVVGAGAIAGGATAIAVGAKKKKDKKAMKECVSPEYRDSLNSYMRDDFGV